MDILSDMRPSNNNERFCSSQKHDTNRLNFIHKVTGRETNDILSDMRPSNNYIINGFVSFRNIIQTV